MRHLSLFLVLSLWFAGQALAVGAIAVDDEEGLSARDVGFGFASGAATRAAAEQEALSECRQAGNAQCAVKAWFETCGAYAVSGRYFGVGWGQTLEDAVNMALEACGTGCKVVVSDCE